MNKTRVVSKHMMTMCCTICSLAHNTYNIEWYYTLRQEVSYEELFLLHQILKDSRMVDGSADELDEKICHFFLRCLNGLLWRL